MKKYNCFEEIKECFGREKQFECEGEVFTFIHKETRKLYKPRYGISVINSKYGINVIMNKFAYCEIYKYRSDKP